MAPPQNSIDLSHHLSDLAKRRNESPLKGLQRFMKPGVLMMAGGMPAPAYFPVATLEAEALAPNTFPTKPVMASKPDLSSWFWNLFGSGSQPKTTHITVPKFAPAGELALAQTLQYGVARGVAPLVDFVNEFVGKVYQPGFANWQTLIHTGNTDGWYKVVSTLCNPGDCILVDEWTYPSIMASAYPLGVSMVPVKIDGEGMRPDDLRRVLSEWDEKKTGSKRPTVMYSVPIGQNPCGLTMGIDRKKEIYDICVENDIIIVEDDPYYFQQEGTYAPKSVRKTSSTKMSDEDWIQSLSPSFLRVDYQGRVIRLDTFSKTLAPGSRLGWFTCNPMFAERLERQAESTTQAPCGFGQSIIADLLANQWGYSGYIRWLRGVTNQYIARRDFLMDVISEEFDLALTPSAAQGIWSNLPVYVARERVTNSRSQPTMSEKDALFARRRLFSLAPPSSGMFVWIKLHLENHQRYAPGKEETLEQKFMIKLAEAGLLVGPGWFFDPIMYSAHGITLPERPAAEAHFRISFSLSEQDDMRKAIRIFSDTLKKFNSPQ